MNEDRQDLLDEILASMPRFQESVQNLKERGCKTRFLYSVANPDDKFTFFKKKGKREYQSDCPHFKGYYLDGVCGATKCAACDILLPGSIWTIQCQRHYDDCPIFLKSNEQKGI